MIYFDNSATTMLYPEVISTINEKIDIFGNPSAMYKLGIIAENEIENSKEIISNFINCDKSEIYFTSGGTESNNMAILGAVYSKKRRGNTIITTSIEHPSVLKVFEKLKNEGFNVEIVRPRECGNIFIEDITEKITSDTIFISMMLVNNLTGAILPIEKLRQACIKKKSEAIIHTDCVAALGKIPINLRKLDVDMASFSAHKVHSLKGTGVLYKKNKINIIPLILGGGQQNNLRSGTENTIGIIAFGKAISVKQQNFTEKANNMLKIKNYLIENLITDEIINNTPKNSSPGILNISLLKYRPETVLHALESDEVYISAGSACSSKKGNSSSLSGFNYNQNQSESAIRISFGDFNTIEEAENFVKSLNFTLRNLIKNKS
ncbi:MAG: cysteine desulfurase family protein [Clostridia bacterium]